MKTINNNSVLNSDAAEMYMSCDYGLFIDKYYLYIRSIISKQVKKSIINTIDAEISTDFILDYVIRSLDNFDPNKSCFATWLNKTIHFKVLSCIENLRKKQEISLNTQIVNENGDSAELIDLIADDSLENTDDIIFMEELINASWEYFSSTVSGRHKDIICQSESADTATIAKKLYLKDKAVEKYICAYYYFGRKHSIKDIAEKLNINQLKVRRNIFSLTADLKIYLSDKDFI